MASPVRNPIAVFLLAVAVSFVLSVVVAFATTLLPFVEFQLFFLGFVLFGIGALASRRAFLGSLGFIGAYLGSFVGLYLGEVLFWVNPYMALFDPYLELIALAFAAACGLGGFVAGKLGLHRLIKMERVTPGLRRCHNCGNRVGASAHKCWSCKATLTY